MKNRMPWFLRACYVVALAATLSMPVQVFAFTAGSVISHDIKAADGTTGQDINTGSGVKTGHIQDGAITTSKIADGSVTNAKIGAGAVNTGNIVDGGVASPKIADGAVTDAKITGPISGAKLGAHGHSGADITDGTVTMSKIADGAVTDSKITGPISGTKLGVHFHYGSEIVDSTINTQKIADGAITDAKITGPISADKISGGTFAKKVSNKIIVAKIGGDFQDIQQAIDSVSDATADNPYVIEVNPGVYNIGTTSINMKPYVSLVGHGEVSTKIIGTYLTYLVAGEVTTGMINTANNTIIKNLTIENQSVATNNSYTVGICNNNTSPTIANVTVNIPNSSGRAYGIQNYGYSAGSKAVISNCTINIGGTGGAGIVLRRKCSPYISDTKINMAGVDWGAGISVDDDGNGAIAIIERCSINIDGNPTSKSGYGYTFGIYSNGQRVYVYNSRISVKSYNIAEGVKVYGQSADIINSAINSESDAGMPKVSISGVGAVLSVANSGLFGTIETITSTIKCVNTYNGSYDLIICQ